jgi:hypothetical protein
MAGSQGSRCAQYWHWGCSATDAVDWSTSRPGMVENRHLGFRLDPERRLPGRADFHDLSVSDLLAEYAREGLLRDAAGG